MIREIEAKYVKQLFDNWEESLIWSCLDGTMGHLYATGGDNPRAVMAIIADFCFLAGEPDEELVRFKPKWCSQDFIIMVPQSDKWSLLIEKVYGKDANKVTRFATQKSNDTFNREKLKSMEQNLSSEYHLEKIDKELFDQCKANDWSHDLVSHYPDYESYQRLGLGVVAMKDNEILSGASSYTRYQDGIEIEIDTKEQHRRKGLALACGAKLILECMERNLYPNWDAQNKGSLELAEKLGYQFSHEYTAYEILAY